MSKTIEEIKEHVAKEKSFRDWESLRSAAGIDYFENRMNEIAERYAQFQTQELTDWKESMMKVHSELDLQGIGNALGLPLGSSIAPQVLPKVNELIEHNSELIEAVWYLYNFSKGYHFHEGSKTDKEISELLTKYNHLKSNTNGNTIE